MNPTNPINKLSVVIPARDEEKTIQKIIDGVRPYADEIIVVDGHSKDRTREISARMGARVIMDHGIGKGDALRLAIKEVKGDIILFIDADCSHDTRDIPRIIDPIVKGDADMVIGSRIIGGSDELGRTLDNFIRLVGSQLITVCINYRFGVNLSDSQNGFRAIRTSVARHLGLKEEITTIEQEMLMRCLKKGYRVSEVPAHEYARKYGDSKVILWRVGFRFLWSTLKGLL